MATVPAMALPAVPYRAVMRRTPGFKITRATIGSCTSMTEKLSGIFVSFGRNPGLIPHFHYYIWPELQSHEVLRCLCGAHLECRDFNIFLTANEVAGR